MKRTITSMIIILLLSFTVPGRVFAAENTELSWEDKAKLRSEEEIQSNLVDGWPAGPAVSAESAIVLESGTGTILYAKNIHEELYPASTTKLLTCLIAVEEANLNDIVEFSHEAIDAVPSDGSNIGISAGEYMTLEKCLYGIMVGSANEAANAVAEHVSGSIPAFADRMNERAKELGCLNSHFVNPNGLHDDDHYTSAYDLALIGAAFFGNEFLSGVGGVDRYHFEPEEGQPDDFWLKNKHKLINGEIPYSGIVGGKTGYTSLARETLVTCADREGMRLICVVMYEESPTQFTDTVTLLDYGFDNFKRINAADWLPVMDTEGSLFSLGVGTGTGKLLEYDKNSMMIVPVDTSADLVSREMDFHRDDSWPEDAIAEVTFSLSGLDIGRAFLLIRKDIDLQPGINTITDPAPVITVDVRAVAMYAAIVALSLIFFAFLVDALFSSNLFRSTGRRMRRRR